MIRPATVDDAPAMAAAIHAQPLFVRYGVTEAGLARDLVRALQADEHVLVAEDDGIAGIAWYLPNGGLGVGGYLKIIATATGRESRGIGKALLEAVEAAIPTRHLLLLVSDFNARAQRFYEHAGYAQRGRLPSLVLPGVDELLYQKRLR